MAGALRRLLVMALTLAGGWLAWERQAPPDADWLQPLLDAARDALNLTDIKAPLLRALVGAGTGSLLAFLLLGGLWRAGRVFAMSILLGGAAAAGYYVSTQEDAAAWLARELEIAGEASTVLVSLALASLLLGLFDLLRPGPASDASRLSVGSVLWRVTALVLLIAGGLVAWASEAPPDADWLQPLLDAVQDAFAAADVKPAWARALAGTGAAGLLAFMFGGGLWRFSKFLAMLVVMALGGGAGWGLTTPEVADWLAARQFGVEGLVPCMLVGLAGAGTLLGLFEWLGSTGPGWSSSNSMVPDRPGKNLGFKLPAGKFTARLAGGDGDFDRAIAEIVALAEKGNRTGLDEIESFIRDNTAAAVEFHQPGLRMFSGAFDPDKAIAQAVAFARDRGLFAHARAVQQEMSQLAMLERLADAMHAVQRQVGTRQRRCFQVLYEQLRINAAFLKAKR